MGETMVTVWVCSLVMVLVTSSGSQTDEDLVLKKVVSMVPLAGWLEKGWVMRYIVHK